MASEAQTTLDAKSALITALEDMSPNVSADAVYAAVDALDAFIRAIIAETTGAV